MGWTGTHRPYRQPLEAFFAEELGFDKVDSVHEFAGFSTVKRSTCYAAVRNRASGEVFAIVILVKYTLNDHYNITYKVMEEDSHPYQYECPTRILDMLTPTQSQNAEGWRFRCRARKEAKKTVRYGDVLKFTDPLSFRGGMTDDTFTVERYGRQGKAYRSHKHGFLCRIGNIGTRSFDILPNA
jgi:hypothetical protein